LLQKEPELIGQANEALIEHVKANNRKWVDLMLWLGADLRGKVALHENDSTTALIEAARYGRVDLLRRFKVDPNRDDLVSLLTAPAKHLDLQFVIRAAPQVEESVEYLMSFGLPLQQPSKSRFSIMGEFFREMEWESPGLYGCIYPHRLMRYVVCLAKHGLRWEGEARCVRLRN
jgi:hypothetical protein